MAKTARKLYKNNSPEMILKHIDKIPPVENIEEYLNFTIEKANHQVKELKRLSRGTTPVARRKETTIYIISTIKKKLLSQFNKITASFPNPETFSEFTKSLISCFIDIRILRKAIDRVNGLKTVIPKIERDIKLKIQKSHDVKEINDLKRIYIGKLYSLSRKNYPVFENLETIRINLKKVPVIDESLYTVAIAGFPNVGKSSLLKKMTKSNVEINNYPFTTKQLMIGKIKQGYQEIQLIDAPGILNRNKTNIIEQQAIIVTKKLADMIVYVFDLTESYPIDDQIKLYKRIKRKTDKKLIVYLSKTDILNANKVKEFAKKYKNSYLDSEELKEKIISEFKKNRILRIKDKISEAKNKEE